MKETSQIGKYQHGGHADNPSKQIVPGSNRTRASAFITCFIIAIAGAGFWFFNGKTTSAPKTAMVKFTATATGGLIASTTKEPASPIKNRIIPIKPYKHARQFSKTACITKTLTKAEPAIANQTSNKVAEDETQSADSASSTLDEMVVMGVTSAKKTKKITANTTPAAAEQKTLIKPKANNANALPQVGWEGFNKYLKDNAVSPDGKTGVVKLSFTVAQDGIISDIKVLKGLSPDADKKAIDLINAGPDWSGNAAAQAETVKVKIKFSR
jgi:hypothetical protein